MNKNNKGFTLAELLIVIAIIAVLVAISIPIFSSQLEKAREATDLANVRSAYAEVMVAANSDDHDSAIYDSMTGGYKASVELVQKQKDWQSTVTELGGVEKSDSTHWVGVPQQGGKCTITYSEDNGVILNWNGYTYTLHARWTYGNSLYATNGVGQTLVRGNLDSNQYVTSVDQPLSGKIGSTVTLKTPDDEKLKNCQLGFFAVDPKTNTILYDSGRINFSSTKNSTTITAPANSDYTGEVDIYIQLFNDRGTTKYEVTDADAEKLMQLISVN